MSDPNRRTRLVIKRQTGMVMWAVPAIIYADEIELGELGNGQLAEFLVEPGNVRMHAKIGRMTSDFVEISMHPGDVVELSLCQRTGILSSPVLFWEVTKKPNKSGYLAPPAKQIAETDIFSLERRLATLAQARQEAQNSVQQFGGGNAGNGYVIGSIALFLIGLALILTGGNGSAAGFGWLVLAAGGLLLALGLKQKTWASKSYDEAKARLKKIEDETFELQRKLKKVRD